MLGAGTNPLPFMKLSFSCFSKRMSVKHVDEVVVEQSDRVFLLTYVLLYPIRRQLHTEL